MNIRDLDPERDAAAIAALIRSVHPTATINAASWLHGQRSTPERARDRTWVAEVDGEVVGRTLAFLNFFGGTAARVYVAVREPARGQGIGSALYERALEHALSLEPSAIATDFYENDAGVRFAKARGFRAVRAERIAVLDPRTVSGRPSAEVRPLTEANLRDAHRIDETATREMPQLEQITEIPYDEWVQFVVEEPLFAREGSFLAYADGEAAALSLLLADRESGRGTNMFTGTLPEFCGRGLGTAAKLASIHWAAENGITQMATSNDETNEAMLAINRKLGYRPAGRRVEYVAQST